MTDLKFCSTDGVARVVFKRPRVLNALSPKLLKELIEVCADLEQNDSTKVVVFEGAGSSFSAGADLPAFLAELSGPDARAVAARRAEEAAAAGL